MHFLGGVGRGPTIDICEESTHLIVIAFNRSPFFSWYGKRPNVERYHLFRQHTE